jgi:hypothetical protein
MAGQTLVGIKSGSGSKNRKSGAVAVWQWAGGSGWGGVGKRKMIRSEWWWNQGQSIIIDRDMACQTLVVAKKKVAVAVKKIKKSPVWQGGSGRVAVCVSALKSEKQGGQNGIKTTPHAQILTDIQPHFQNSGSGSHWLGGSQKKKKITKQSKKSLKKRHCTSHHHCHCHCHPSCHCHCIHCHCHRHCHRHCQCHCQCHCHATAAPKRDI